VTENDAELESLLGFLRDARGFDFTGYKRTSLNRRIRKRMRDVNIDQFNDYRDLLETNAAEFDALFNTMLINVTGFFRDASAWQYLQRDVLPQILEQAAPSEEIRLWSAGCSSGEEAYSLAIAFAELLGISEFADRVKIYGTDVDEEALHQARAGLYSAKTMETLPDELCDKYFEPAGGGHLFRPDLRRRVIFGRHDITRDAPISRLHLLACRNTLMYFNVETQSQIIDRFHFALRDGGYLFLGKAEMLLTDGDRFDVANMRQRVFRRRPGGAALALQPAIRFESVDPLSVAEDSRRRQVRDLALEVDPNGVIALDQDGNVVLANSKARAAFALSDADIGRPFRDLDISYRPTELRSLIERVQSELRPLRVNAVENRRGVDDIDYYDVLIQPLTVPDRGMRGIALVFIDTTYATHMEHELKRSREDLETAYEELQSTNEELETTNEELQSSIEELETTNEELQSTNEELETTNEELQSGNEELETMNEEMRSRSAELDDARTFLEGILTSIAAAVVVLDADLSVRAWNRGAQDMWGLRLDEVEGRQFFELEFGLPVRQLLEATRTCLATGMRSERPLEVDAVNRLGAGIRCVVGFSPLNGHPNEGVVLLIEQDGDRGSPRR
jgi:two-component system CheB/CheR fusion protein